MIEVQGLTKRYRDFLAIEGVSFNASKGQVVGLLGPNGCGKTTTMRILSCFMPATAGTARICGFDIWEDPMQVRKHIGYMPESVPLYREMRVREYLDFRGRLRGLDRPIRQTQISNCIARCGIEEFENVIIGKLSKGQRQRVGLAATLLGDPEVLIFDEPTVGLDPNQIRSIRTLIRELGGERTVILSSHILSEIEAVCDHVVMMNEGRVAVAGSLTDVTKAVGSKVRVIVRGDGKSALEALKAVTGVKDISRSEGENQTELRLDLVAGRDLREALVKAVCASEDVLLELRGGRHSIEDVFVRITAGGGS